MTHTFDRAEINNYNKGSRRNGQIVFRNIMDNTEISIQLKVGQILDVISQLNLRPSGSDTAYPHKTISIYK